MLSTSRVVYLQLREGSLLPIPRKTKNVTNMSISSYFFLVVRERDSFFILVKVTKTFRHVTFAIITLATQTVYHFLEEKASTRLKLLTFELSRFLTYYILYWSHFLKHYNVNPLHEIFHVFPVENYIVIES